MVHGFHELVHELHKIIYQKAVKQKTVSSKKYFYMHLDTDFELYFLCCTFILSFTAFCILLSVFLYFNSSEFA